MIPSPPDRRLFPVPRALVLPESARVLILAHVRDALPEEACGLLSGRRDRLGLVTVVSAHPTDNVIASNRTRRFEVDPAAHARLARHLRGSGLDIVGHFHSHPDAGPDPSAADRDSMTDPNAIWVIAGRDRSAPDGLRLTAWWVEGWVRETGRGRFKPLAIIGQGGEDAAAEAEAIEGGGATPPPDHTGDGGADDTAAGSPTPTP